MDKIQLTEFRIAENETIQTVVNGVAVTVNKTIPYEKVLDAIQWCIDFIINDRPFISAPLKRIVKDFAILKWYTNLDISFMEEFHEMKDIYENYDIADSYGVIEQVKAFIEKKQAAFFDKTLDETLEAIEKYRNSARGIVDTLADSAKDDTSAMQEALDLIGDEEQNKKIVDLLKFAEEIK